MDSLPEIVEQFFSPSGPVSGHPDFEVRPQQRSMAVAVAETLERNEHLIVEAPTGVGKTLAYLIPALLFAQREQRKAVVSTHTRNLQEQLLHKDIPLAQKLCGRSIRAVALKGRRNYLCPTRLRAARAAPSSLFARDEITELLRIQAWASRTPDGDIEGLGFVPNAEVWNAVCSEQGICTTRGCGSDCFFQQIKERARKAELVIVNHALFFTLLAGREVENRYIFDNDFVIFDEAHTLEAVAGNGLGKRLSHRQVLMAIHRLYNPKTKKGIATKENRTVRRLCAETERAADAFFDSIQQAARALAAPAGEPGLRAAPLLRIRTPGLVSDDLSGPLTALQGQIQKLEEATTPLEKRQELVAARRGLMEAQSVVAGFLSQVDSSLTYWIEFGTNRGEPTALCAAPSDVSSLLEPILFRSGTSAIMTSATLSVEGSLRYFQQRIGGTEVRTKIVDSPFDHRHQMKICIARDIPEPDTDLYAAALPSWIMRSIDRTGGKALVLFTSTALLRSAAAALAPEFVRRDLRLLVQGSGIPRHKLLEEFKRDVHSVLFGLDSFWMGVDVPGEALEHVIITRLPFAVPNHPLIETRLEAIARNGGNSFLEYSLPEAVLKFRQGSGRLIRTQTDSGILTLLDSRILHRSYGRAFLSSLPRCPVELLSSSGETEDFSWEFC